MAKNKFSYVIYFLIGFALLGFITMLIKNPSRLLMSLIMTVVIGFILYKVLSYVLMRRQGGGGNSDEMKKYRQAVKQSQAKYQPASQQKIKKTTTKTKVQRRKKRRHAPHLRVIEGNKNKTNKNDRVL